MTRLSFAKIARPVCFERNNAVAYRYAWADNGRDEPFFYKIFLAVFYSLPARGLFLVF